MKKLLSLLLVLAVLPFSVNAAQEERMLGIYQMPEDVRDTVYILSMAYLNDSLYANDNSDIYVLREGDQEFSLYAKRDEENRVDRLFTDGEKLYGLSVNNGIIYELGNDSGNLEMDEKFKLDFTNHMRTYDAGDKEMEYTDYPQTVEMIGDKLCALYNMPESDQGVLSVFDLATGEEETYDDIKNIRDISPYKDGKLLIITRDYMNPDDPGMFLSVFDVVTGEVEELGALLSDEKENVNFYGSVAYYPEGDFVFFIQEGNVMKRNDDGTSERIGYIPVSSSFGHDQMAMLSQNRFAIAIDKDVHIISLDPKDLPSKTLTILGSFYSNAHEKAIKKLEGTAVNSIDFYGDPAKELSQRLVSGDNDIDIMIVQPYNTDIPNLINKGYAVDFSDIEGLKEYYDSLYPYYKEVNPDDGKIYALPVSSQVNNISCNPDLFEKLGIKVPETFDEFCDCLAWWYDNPDITDEYNFMDMPDVKNMVWAMLFSVYNDYMHMSGQELKYDTPEFKAMSEKLRASAAKVPEFEYSESGNNMTEFYEKATLFGWSSLDLREITYYNRAKREKETYEKYMTESDDDESPSYAELYPSFPIMLKVKSDVPAGLSTYVNYLMINSQSKNIDTAKAYIKANIESQDYEDKAPLLESFNELVENPYYKKSLEYCESEIKNTEKALESAEGAEKTELESTLEAIKDSYQKMLEGEDKYQYTKEDLEQYKSYLKYVYVPSYENNVINREEQIYKLRQRFIDGQIDVETFVKEMDAKIKLIKLENK